MAEQFTAAQARKLMQPDRFTHVMPVVFDWIAEAAKPPRCDNHVFMDEPFTQDELREYYEHDSLLLTRVERALTCLGYDARRFRGPNGYMLQISWEKKE